MKKIIAAAAVVLLLTALCLPLFAGEAEQKEAESIGLLLAAKLSPESLEVTVADGGRLAWIVARGSRQDSIRVEKTCLLARLKAQPASTDLSGGRKLASLVESSDAEIELLEKDVNNYFASVPAAASGLSDLAFDFKPGVFTATGVYKTKLFIELKLDVEAEGRLGLRSDGLYIEEPVLRVEGLRQPAAVTNELIGSLNPLLSFSSLPFPVSFTRVAMTDRAAVMTGDPKPLAGGEKWSWHK